MSPSMKEVFDFRIPESDASRFLPDTVGQQIGDQGWIRRVLATPLDSDFDRVRQLFKMKDRGFAITWSVRRQYSRHELGNAELLVFGATRVIAPAGEEGGTMYDDSRGCALCGAGAPQITPLYLDDRRLPVASDIVATISGEIVVSERFVALLSGMGIANTCLAPMYSSQSRREIVGWQQLQPASLEMVEIDATTRFGWDPFDEKAGGNCPMGDTVGASRTSELAIRRSSWDGNDIVRTTQSVGIRRGLLRPQPSMLLSHRIWKAIDENQLRGFSTEVARLLPGA